MHHFLKFIFRRKLYMFRIDPLSVIGVFHCTHSSRYMSYEFADSLLASCQQTCVTYTTAVCKVKNS